MTTVGELRKALAAFSDDTRLLIDLVGLEQFVDVDAVRPSDTGADKEACVLVVDTL